MNDREKIIDLLRASFKKQYEERSWAINTLRTADYLIENGVTVQKRGRWDDSGRYKFLNGEKAIRCSECGCCLHEEEYENYHWHYCPNCGAKMDGGI